MIARTLLPRIGLAMAACPAIARRRNDEAGSGAGRTRDRPGPRMRGYYRIAGEARRPVVVILPGAEGGDEAGRRFGPTLARPRLCAAQSGLP